MNETPRHQFETLLAAVLPSAFGLAIRLANNRDDAEDLLQDASIRAFNAFAQFQSGTNFKAWFFRVLVTTFLNLKRRENASPQIAQLAEDETIDDLYLLKNASQSASLSRQNDPAKMLLQKLESQQIADALHALPHDFRVVAVLNLVEQMSYEEIAQIVGCPVGTVRSRLHRSRKMLQKSLWQLAKEKGFVEN